ncbi:hypothetical protein ABIE67_005440 [Streptomyces sp. V4I8]
MLRRLCTARETKLQLAASLARGQPKAIEVKITSLGCLKIECRLDGKIPCRLDEAGVKGGCDAGVTTLKAARYPMGSSVAMWTILAPGHA